MGTRSGRREAVLELQPDLDDLDADYRDTERFRAEWNEEFGWSFTSHIDGTPTGDTIHHGFTAVPTPTDVAVWLVTMLTVPHLEVSRDDGPYRMRHETSPEFEAALRRYVTDS